jgi:hypothetical protein
MPSRSGLLLDDNRFASYVGPFDVNSIVELMQSYLSQNICPFGLQTETQGKYQSYGWWIPRMLLKWPSVHRFFGGVEAEVA